jgi:nucleoid DNA-binding protein
MATKEKQRLNIKQMTALTSKKSGYTSEEVRDVLEVFYDMMRQELYKGNSILFERLFRIEIIKPEPKRIRDLKTGKIVLSAAHPRPKLTPSRGLLDYIRAQKGTTLKVKRGTASRRLQHHKHTEQGDYYTKKEKLIQEEFPLPR